MQTVSLLKSEIIVIIATTSRHQDYYVLIVLSLFSGIEVTAATL